MIRRLRNLWRLSGIEVGSDPLDRRMDETETRLARALGDVAALAARLETVATATPWGGDLQLLSGKLEATRRELDPLKPAVTLARADLDGIQSLLTTLQSELGRVQTLIASNKPELEALQSLLRTTRDDLSTQAGILAATRSEQERTELILDAAHSRADVPPLLFRSLEEYRNSSAYRGIFTSPNPMVSVCVATFNRAKVLLSRCLPSILGQNYPNFEVIVVGDRCTDDTQARVVALGDPRVRFAAVTDRDEYPEDPVERWMVAGTPAAILAESLAKGSLLCHLDDDDEFLPGRLRKVVDFLQESRAEVVVHPFLWETAPGTWETNPAHTFRHAQATTGSVTFLDWFRKVPWDGQAYRYREPGDWNRFRKFRYLGARVKRLSDPLLRHYREHNQT